MAACRLRTEPDRSHQAGAAGYRVDRSRPDVVGTVRDRGHARCSGRERGGVERGWWGWGAVPKRDTEALEEPRQALDLEGPSLCL